MNKALQLATVTLATLTCCSGCRPSAAVETSRTTVRPVSVTLVAASQSEMERTTTQPATVHAFFEARVFAKAAGYLIELNTDIGSTVN